MMIARSPHHLDGPRRNILPLYAPRPGWVVSLVLILASCAGADRPAGEASDETERAAIIAASNAFMSAGEEGDAAAMAAMFTANARIMPPGVEDIVGISAIREMVEGLFSGVERDVEIVSREIAIHGDTAFELANYTETRQPPGQEATTVAGRYLIVWHRQADGTWKVHRNMFNFKGHPD